MLAEPPRLRYSGEGKGHHVKGEEGNSGVSRRGMTDGSEK